MRLWERICKDWGDFGGEFGRLWERIHETLGEDFQTLGEDSGDFGRGFARITEDLQGFVRLWERIRKDL